MGHCDSFNFYSSGNISIEGLVTCLRWLNKLLQGRAGSCSQSGASRRSAPGQLTAMLRTPGRPRPWPPTTQTESTTATHGPPPRAGRSPGHRDHQTESATATQHGPRAGGASQGHRTLSRPDSSRKGQRAQDQDSRRGGGRMTRGHDHPLRESRGTPSRVTLHPGKPASWLSG